MAEKLKADLVREKTKELLGKDDIDYAYITEESIQADAETGDDAEAATSFATLYGNNARYGTRTIGGVNYQVYYFDTQGNCSNPAHACGSASVCFARMDLWHHQNLGTCPSGREKWSFSQ